VPHRNPQVERRRWERLPLAIPVFVRGRDDRGKDFLEFATALNISAGGALVAMGRGLPPNSAVSLEIPSGPLAGAEGFPNAVRRLRARLCRAERASQYTLHAFKFSRPLLSDTRRKLASTV
jgi:PilZ domain